MVCTFGDATDVEWWREKGLALRQLVGRDGRLLPVEFGSEAFPSRDADAANRAYAEIANKSVSRARTRKVDLLGDPAGRATGVLVGCGPSGLVDLTHLVPPPDDEGPQFELPSCST